MDEKWLHLHKQKVRDFCSSCRVHCHCPQIFLRLHVIEHRTIHRDDGKAQSDAGRQFTDGCRRLFCCDGKEHAVLDESVQLDPGKGREIAVLAEEDMIDSGYEQGLTIPDSWKMNRIGQDRNADTDGCIQCSVEYKNVGVGVSYMIYGDAEEDNSREIRGFGDFEHDGRVKDNAYENSQNDVIEDRAFIFNFSTGYPESAKEDARSPEGTDQGAGDPVLTDLQHVGGVGLNALECRDDGVERCSTAAAEKVYNKTYECRGDRPEDSLSGHGEAGFLWC